MMNSQNIPERDLRSESIKPEAIIEAGDPEFDKSEFTIDENVAKLSQTKNLFVLRLVCFIGALLCFLFTLGLLVYAGLLLALACVCLFKNRSINQTFYSFSRLFVNFLVFTVGLALAVLSPTLGIGFLIVYFAVKGERKDREMFKNALHRFF